MGPGTELKKLLKSIGITPLPTCRCEKTIQLMNDWGVAGCNLPENYCYIVTTMEEDAKKYGWSKRVTAAGRMILSGLKVKWLSPIPGLITESIRRAEAVQPPPGSGSIRLDGLLPSRPPGRSVLLVSDTSH